MNPNGKVRDYNSLKDLINVEAGLLSPDNCAELITALQLHQGRGNFLNLDVIRLTIYSHNRKLFELQHY